jgi:HEAT repeat protein
MARAISVDSKLARLRLLCDEPPSTQVTQELRKALADASNLVVAAAAAAVTPANGAGLAPDLVAAFDRLLVNPVKADKLCRAKGAIVEALDRLEVDDADFFRRGTRYVQMEPVWAGEVDAAGLVRVGCAFGLVRVARGDALADLADLLADELPMVRAGAARALAVAPAAALPLLRLKVRLGDKEPEVTGECLTALIQLGKPATIPLVAEYLDAGAAAVRSAAALALGDARHPDSLGYLTAAWQHGGDAEFRATVLVAIALLRLPAATEFLLGLLGGAAADAAAAVAALAVLRHDPRVRERVAAAVTAANSAELRRVFEKKFRLG